MTKMNEQTWKKLGKYIFYVGYTNFMVLLCYFMFIVLPILFIHYIFGLFNIWIDVFDIVDRYVGENESMIIMFFIYTFFYSVFWDVFTVNRSIFDEVD